MDNPVPKRGPWLAMILRGSFLGAKRGNSFIECSVRNDDLNIRRVIRNVIAHCLYYTGILPVLARVRFNSRVLVLMYHRVVTEEERNNCFSQDGIIVASGTFEKQMRFLREHFNLLSLGDFIACIEDGRAYGRNSCLVTFDDGWGDNYRNAYPILKQYRIPAVIFLASDFVGGKEPFWQERITDLLYRCRRTYKSKSDLMVNMEKELADEHIGRIIRCEQRNMREHLSGYITLLKQKSKEERERIIEDLSQLVRDSAPGATEKDVFMSWDEIREMSANGISFASHGKSHVILTRMSRPEVEREARESGVAIEEALGLPIAAFSYPNGDCSEDVIDVVRSCGYRAAFTTREGTHAAGDDSFRIRRYNIHEDMTASIPMFMARIVGLW